MYFVINIF